MDDSDPRAQERVGSVLDEKWTLERILGSGGMGAVYAARHRNGARAAVKVLHPELARRDDVRERFLREGYAANRVEHRGAVQVLDDDVVKEGVDEGTAYLVMEILEGESLEERIDRGPALTELELLRVLDDVLSVLEAAHEHGVIHRDLKPANLFLNKDPAGPGVKVLDFGLARIEEARSVTGVGLALGTPSFMAPEQANGRTAEIDARTDLFAVGATAFMILTGRGVHEAEGLLELVARMGTLPAPKIREITPAVSEAMARIVDRALEFKREDRYPTAAAMRADVQSALTALSPTTMATVANDAALEPPPASTREPRMTAPPASSSRPRRSLAPFVLLFFVAAGLVLVFVPQARERAGVANAMGELFPANADASPNDATAATSTSSLSVPPPLDASAAVADASPPTADSDDAAASALSDAVTDASADAAGDASADDDDDDDEPDASDAPALAGGRDAASPQAAHPPKAGPRTAPAPPKKHGKPPRKRPKRQKR